MKYLTIKQASKLIHVTPLTLRNRPYRNPANNYRVYRLDQIENFLRKIELSKAKQAKRKIDIF